MRFDTSLQRLFIALALAFTAVLLATSYWAIAGPETVLRGPYNYRLRDDAARIVRGTILDRDGDILTVSALDENGRVTRAPITADLFALIGYSSLQYGTSGVENAFDAQLTGADLYSPLEARYGITSCTIRASAVMSSSRSTTPFSAQHGTRSLTIPVARSSLIQRAATCWRWSVSRALTRRRLTPTGRGLSSRRITRS
ncbi:MAG: peptidoglycan glycosyltransferase [Chloroflexi bacterium OLB13]|nr:MAG: peptidoglycan glycosyltransferase [Chloroflexi bacterium OLB13]